MEQKKLKRIENEISYTTQRIWNRRTLVESATHRLHFAEKREQAIEELRTVLSDMTILLNRVEELHKQTQEGK